MNVRIEIWHAHGSFTIIACLNGENLRSVMWHLNQYIKYAGYKVLLIKDE